MKSLEGLKTYISAGALFLFALYGLYTGHLDPTLSVTLMCSAATAAGIRHGISTTFQKVLTTLLQAYMDSKTPTLTTTPTDQTPTT